MGSEKLITQLTISKINIILVANKVDQLQYHSSWHKSIFEYAEY